MEWDRRRSNNFGSWRIAVDAISSLHGDALALLIDNKKNGTRILPNRIIDTLMHLFLYFYNAKDKRVYLSFPAM